MRHARGRAKHRRVAKGKEVSVYHNGLMLADVLASWWKSFAAWRSHRCGVAAVRHMGRIDYKRARRALRKAGQWERIAKGK